MTYWARLAREAAGDFQRLLGFFVKLELHRHDADLEIVERAPEFARDGSASLGRSPFTCGKASGSLSLREFVIPFGYFSYMALFEIVDNDNVVVAAVRHQRENDYHYVSF